MTVHFGFTSDNYYPPVKYFLTSYRALSDGRSGIRHLEQYLNSSKLVLSDWMIAWIGTCTLLRTSIDLFKVDANSCINLKIREQIRSEWELIKENEKDHPIFWQFLKEERNNIIHEYKWAVQEVWMEQDGTTRVPTPLLDIKPEDASSILIMKNGPYKNRNSLDLLKESAEWVEERIYSAIRRAEFDPDEKRHQKTFKEPPPVDLPVLKAALLGKSIK